MIRLRHAASAAAPPHIAGARHALAAWRLARAKRGGFILRIDDLGAGDPDDLRRDLAWLGLEWDGCVLASTRRARHAEAAEALKQAGRLYPCFESAHELEAKRDQRARRGKPTVYDRAMLRLTPEQRARAEAGGKRPYWRFRLSDTVLAWQDACLGQHREKLQAISDPILLDAEGTPAPALAAAVDDGIDGITHLLRGAEQTASSAIHLDLLAALGLPAPALIHLPTLEQEDTRRRPQGLSLRQLRADGIEPEALAATLCGPDPLAPCAAPARFRVADLLAQNRARLAALPFEAVAARLPPGATAPFWAAIAGGIDRLREARLWWDVTQADIVPPALPQAAPLLRRAAALLPPEPWDAATWQAWHAALADPRAEPALRLALTGEDAGPDLAGLLPLIGRARAARRLELAAC